MFLSVAIAWEQTPTLEYNGTYIKKEIGDYLVRDFSRAQKRDKCEGLI